MQLGASLLQLANYVVTEPGAGNATEKNVAVLILTNTGSEVDAEVMHHPRRRVQQGVDLLKEVTEYIQVATSSSARLEIELIVDSTLSCYTSCAHFSLEYVYKMPLSHLMFQLR